MIWLVEDGYKKGKYRIRWRVSSLERAILLYECINECINTGLGYKKRIRNEETGQVFARYIS
jgi:hypothetical protein